MFVLFVSYMGGVFTILSPCILPVLPFVFARADRPFRSHGLPLLMGMALAFAAVATLAALGGGWVVSVNQYGRYLAIALLAAFGLTLLIPTLGDRLTRPLVTLGMRLAESRDHGISASHSISSALVLGVATGLLWAPCAGPVLGLILTGAAINGASVGTTLLLLAYAAGAATSLAAALLFGGRLLSRMKRSLAAGEVARRAAGAMVLVGVAAIALGLDTGVLARLSLGSTTNLENALVERLDREAPPPAMNRPPVDATLTPVAMFWPQAPLRQPGIEGLMAPLAGATEWINSPPLTREGLRGKVVLVEFWTYSCINCLRALPYVRAWADKYREAGLVVIGVHTPEFAFEKRPANVARAVRDLDVTFPVAVDSDFAIWRSFANQYWPAMYFVDAQGRIRHHQFGENEYQRSEEVIQQLLAESGNAGILRQFVSPLGKGTQAAAAAAMPGSGETYLGYEQARNFASPLGAARDRSRSYELPASLRANQWALAGDWMIERDRVVMTAAGGRIAYRFNARDLHLVLGPSADGRPVRFRVLVDGKAPREDHGSDTDAQGNGTIDAERLYQLVRQTATGPARLFEIQFLDPGVQAYVFTFG